MNMNYYNTILAQAFSPCGKFLFVGDYYGTISVFNLHKILTSSTSNANCDTTLAIPPLATYPLQSSYNTTTSATIHSMITTPSYLLVGTVGAIYGLSWSRNNNSYSSNSKEWRPQWRIEIPGKSSPSDRFDCSDAIMDFRGLSAESGGVEINAMVWDESSGCVYVGGGDGMIYLVDVEQGKVTKSLGGHKGLVHGLDKFNQELVSCSEDGQVLGWDLHRTPFITLRLDPYKTVGVPRPSLGKWVGAVARNDDWLVCGGGPHLALWHVRTMNCSTIYDGIKDAGIHVARFHDDKVIAGGSTSFMYQLRIDGSMVSEIQTSGGAVYSIVIQDGDGRYKAMAIAGSSPRIDVCTNLNYKDLTLTTL